MEEQKTQTIHKQQVNQDGMGEEEWNHEPDKTNTDLLPLHYLDLATTGVSSQTKHELIEWLSDLTCPDLGQLISTLVRPAKFSFIAGCQDLVFDCQDPNRFYSLHSVNRLCIWSVFQETPLDQWNLPNMLFPAHNAFSLVYKGQPHLLLVAKPVTYLLNLTTQQIQMHIYVGDTQDQCFFFHRQQWLISVQRGGIMVIWNVHTSQMKISIVGTSFEWLSDVFSCDDSDEFYVAGFRLWRIPASMDHFEQVCTSVLTAGQLCRNDQDLFGIVTGTIIEIRNIRQGNVTEYWPREEECFHTALTVTRNGKWLFAVAKDMIHRYNTVTKERVETYPWPQPFAVREMFLSPDQRVLFLKGPYELIQIPIDPLQ